MINGLLQGSNEERNRASIADFYDMKALDVSGEAAAFIIETEYGDGYECKEIMNNTAAAVAIVLQTVRTPGTPITLNLNAYQRSGRLPKIYSITKAGTDDGLLLFIQRRK